MKYRRLTENGDYSFGAGQNDYIDGDEAIGQAIKTKILLFYQEWWEDLGLGIPMFQSFIGQTNLETVKNSLSMVIEERINEVQGVKSVKNVEVIVDKSSRSISMEIDVVTSSNTEVKVEVSI